MFKDFNSVLESCVSIQTKEEFFNIFDYPNCFKSNVENLNNDNSLKIARFFSEIYAYENYNDSEIHDCLTYFAKNTQSLDSLENLYYTAFPGNVSDIITRRIVSLDKSKSTSLRIFENEGIEYCPNDIMISIVNGADINKKSASDIYDILWHFEKNLRLSLFPKGATTYQRWIDIYNYCIDNNCVDESMIKYLKDCSSDEDNNLDYGMLKRLSKALELFV